MGVQNVQRLRHWVSMTEFGLPLQGKISYVVRAPWALPTAKMGLRFQRGYTLLRSEASAFAKHIRKLRPTRRRTGRRQYRILRTFRNYELTCRASGGRFNITNLSRRHAFLRKRPAGS